MDVRLLLCDSEDPHCHLATEESLRSPLPSDGATDPIEDIFLLLNSVDDVAMATSLGKRKEPEVSSEFRCHWGGCSDSFSTKSSLATHFASHMPDLADITGTECQWRGCGNSFGTQRETIGHVASHIGQTPFVPRGVIEQGTKRVYRCPVAGCGRAFNDPSNRKKHQLTHDPHRERFFCTFGDCSRSYSTRTDLKIHNKVHLGEFAHRCSHQHCDRAFVRVSELYAHERTHDGMKPHVCGTCNKGFKDKTKWSNHVSRYH